MDKLPGLLTSLYKTVDQLEHLFPGRHFTPDGHMVGSLGEALASYHYGIQLYSASAKTHDGCVGGRQVQIKATQGRSIAISSEPEYLLAIQLNQDGSFSEYYNGPGKHAWDLVKDKPRPKTGQYQVALSTLRNMMRSVITRPEDQIPLVQPIKPAENPLDKIADEEERESAVALMTSLLQQRRLHIDANKYSGSSDRHIRELCSVLLWKHSESNGKYLGCLKWSKEAVRSYERLGRVETNKRRHGNLALRHEHVFPRAQLIDSLFAMDGPSDASVREIMDRLNVGVVVTVEEDNRLAPTGDQANIWARYAAADISVVDGPSTIRATRLQKLGVSES